HLHALQYTPETLLATSGDYDELPSVAKSRCETATAEPKRLALWWIFWYELKPEDARGWMDAQLVAGTTTDGYPIVEAIAARINEWDQSHTPFQLRALAS